MGEVPRVGGSKSRTRVGAVAGELFFRSPSSLLLVQHRSEMSQSEVEAALERCAAMLKDVQRIHDDLGNKFYARTRTKEQLEGERAALGVLS